ncbi:glycine--tRNA ligase [Halobacteriales archaeon QS_3_64_16]|nr:MAG: glycine--tRNA ligase [Halobacteriales archaeon QS_3_64_16]
MTDHDRLTELATRRGFYFPAAGAYGGVAGFYTYGPQGAALKRNVESAWRDRFLTREDHMEVAGPTVMPEPVFEASGHLDGFDDMILECPGCGASHRADHLVEDNTDIEDAEALGTERVAELIAEHDLECPSCGAVLAGESVTAFNLMFGTNIGPGSSAPGYLRPETAQAIFVEFPRLAEYARNQLPFGVGQIGTAYRNEISPRRGLIRVREFTQAELEHFVHPEGAPPDLSGVAETSLSLYPIDSQQARSAEHVETTVGEALEAGVIGSPWIAYYLGIAKEWYEHVGVDMDRFRFRQHLPGERAHYATDCWDAEAELGGNWIEISGFSTRGTYDLSRHADHSGESMTVFEPYEKPQTTERPAVDPDMSYLGPEFGDRAPEVVAALKERAAEEPEAFDGEEIEVTIDGETHAIPMAITGFEIREETISGEHVTPEVIEPSFGVDRVFATVFEHAFRRDSVEGEERTYLSLPPELAPTFVGVFPLMDKDGMGERAKEIADALRERGFAVEYDDSGSIGRRYRRQDEIGTPLCLTVDYESVEGDGSVTLRDRDSAAQSRVPAGEDLDRLLEALADLRAGRQTVAAIKEELGLETVAGDEDPIDAGAE